MMATTALIAGQANHKIRPVITARIIQTAIEYSLHLGVLMLTVFILSLLHRRGNNMYESCQWITKIVKASCSYAQ